MKPLIILLIIVVCGFNLYFVCGFLDDTKFNRLFFKFAVILYAVSIICHIVSFF